MQVVGAVGWQGQRLVVPTTSGDGSTPISPENQELLMRCFGEAEQRPSFSEIISVLRKQLQALGPPSKSNSSVNAGSVSAA